MANKNNNLAHTKRMCKYHIGATCSRFLCGMYHFPKQTVHLPVPGKMGFIFDGADKVSQYVGKVLLMAVAVGDYASREGNDVLCGISNALFWQWIRYNSYSG